MNSSAVNDSSATEYDPTFLHARREAIIVFLVWVVALLWSVPYCYSHGYVSGVTPDSLEMVWGIPSWIVWGVAVPWLVADVFTTWFCFCYMKDDDLGESDEGDHADEQTAASSVADADRSTGAGQ